MNTEQKPEGLHLLELLVEKTTGRSVREIREQPLDDGRKEAEVRFKRRMTFPRKFPVIGRGCIMGDRVKSREEIDRLLDEALR